MMKNAWIKGASVVLAIALWLFVISKGQSRVSMAVHLEFKEVPRGLQVMESGTTQRTSLVIRGQERFIKNLNPDDVHVYLDLKELSKGRHLYEIKNGDVKLPTPLRVVTISPSTATVALEAIISKKVAVRPVIVGLPREGFNVERLEVSPKEVMLEGAESELKDIKVVRTEPVDVSLASGTMVKEVMIDRARLNIRPEPQEVTVKVTIEKES
jgi:YbbR domain-containing protein